MEILLAVAVATVAVASWFIAARFRAEIGDQAVRLERTRKELEQNAEGMQTRCQGQLEQIAAQLNQAELSFSARSDKDRRDWTDEAARARQQLTGIAARQSQNEHESLRNQDLLAQQRATAEQLRVSIAGEAHGRQVAIQRLEQRHGELADQMRVDLAQAADQHRRETATLHRALQEAERRATEAERRATEAAAALAALQDRHAKHLQWAEQQLVEVTNNVGHLDHRLSAIEQHIRRRLSLEAAAGRAVQPILPGGIRAGLAGTLAVLSWLYDDLCTALGLDIIFQESVGPSSVQGYLVRKSPPPGALADELEKLLQACPTAADEAGPGLKELRSLLLAIYHAGPSALQVGPMVVSRMDGYLIGYLLGSDEAAVFVLSQPEMMGSAGQVVRGDPERLVELESWASSYGAQ